MEEWADPELIYFQEPYHPRYPSYHGTKPDLNTIKEAALNQLKQGQQRVQQLRRRLALPDSTKYQTFDMFSSGDMVYGGHDPRKPSGEEGAGASGKAPDCGPKRQPPHRSASPGPSNRAAAAPPRPAAKRARRQADDNDDDDDDDDEAGKGKAVKRQRLTNTAPSASAAATSSAAIVSGSRAVPPRRAALKRTRASTEDDYEKNDGDGDGHGPSGSKRQRLMEGTPPMNLHAASSNSARAHPDQPNPQPAPQQSQSPAQYETPSSQPLNFSRDTITMSKVARMSKTRRPWVFGYSTEEGYGMYAFVDCPGQNCKHHFTSHPLRNHHARDHFLSCNQPFADEQDMVRQYACQGMSLGRHHPRPQLPLDMMANVLPPKQWSKTSAGSQT